MQGAVPGVRKDNEQPGRARMAVRAAAAQRLITESSQWRSCGAPRGTYRAAPGRFDTPSVHGRDGPPTCPRQIHEKQSRCRATIPPHHWRCRLQHLWRYSTPRWSLLNNRVQITVSVPPWSFASHPGTRLCTRKHSGGPRSVPTHPAVNASHAHANRCRSYSDRSGCPTGASLRPLSPSRSRLLCAV